MYTCMIIYELTYVRWLRECLETQWPVVALLGYVLHTCRTFFWLSGAPRILEAEIFPLGSAATRNPAPHRDGPTRSLCHSEMHTALQILADSSEVNCRESTTIGLLGCCRAGFELT